MKTEVQELKQLIEGCKSVEEGIDKINQYYDNDKGWSIESDEWNRLMDQNERFQFVTYLMNKKS